MSFQRMEAFLKYLLAHSNVSGPLDEIEAILEQRIANVNKQTMGQLVGPFIRNVFSSPEERTNEPEALNRIWVSLHFKVDSDSSYYDELEKSLAAAVAARNELVHHFRLKFDLSSTEGASVAVRYLDEQYEKIQPTLEKLKSFVTIVQDGKQASAEYFDSDAFKPYLARSLREQHRVVGLLGDVAMQKARSDGWTNLDTAGQIIRQEAPGELADLKEYYGQRTLKSLLLATELFEVSEEPTSKGGVRVLYRMRPEQT